MQQRDIQSKDPGPEPGTPDPDDDHRTNARQIPTADWLRGVAFVIVAVLAFLALVYLAFGPRST